MTNEKGSPGEIARTAPEPDRHHANQVRVERTAEQHRHADARALTDQIKVAVEAVWLLVIRAYTERAWAALGYSSWDDYCTREFGASRLRLPREDRAEVVSSLRESGLSIRAISSATGESYGTTQAALTSSGDQFRSPEPVEVDEDVLADELIAAEPALAPVIGIDGKRYQPKPQRAQPEPTPSAPRRKPITDAFRSAVFELGRGSERVVRLTADDRFNRNRQELGRSLGYLIHVRDALNDVINQLGGDDAGPGAP